MSELDYKVDDSNFDPEGVDRSEHDTASEDALYRSGSEVIGRKPYQDLQPGYDISASGPADGVDLEFYNALSSEGEEDQQVNNGASPYTNLALVDVARVLLIRTKEREFLTEDTERALALRIQTGLHAGKIPAKGQSSKDRQIIIDDGIRAQEELIEANQPRVYGIALKYSGYNVSTEDLVQAGNIGLIKAARKFDPSLGYRLSTYITIPIRREMQALVANLGHKIPIPWQDHIRLNIIHKARDYLLAILSREPTLGEIAEEHNRRLLENSADKKYQSRFWMTAGRIEELLLAEHGKSFADDLGDDPDDELSLGGMIKDHIFPLPEERAIAIVTQSEDRIRVEEMFTASGLTETEKAVMRLRHLANWAGRQPTFIEVGGALNLHPVYAKSLASAAMKKLKVSFAVDI